MTGDVERLPQNPLISPQDIAPTHPDFRVVGVFNPAVTRKTDEVLLLLRVAEQPNHQDDRWVLSPFWNHRAGEFDTLRLRRNEVDMRPADKRLFTYGGRTYLTTISHLRLARSFDGVHFHVDPRPTITPAHPTETFGIEDPRITRIGSTYWITYKAVSSHGQATALARTDDFESFERLGVILPPGTTNTVLFPKTGDEDYVAWVRPTASPFGRPSIWASRSRDLQHWGGLVTVLTPRPEMWDSARVGPAGVPIQTPAGWLALYHASDRTDRYSLGVALLDNHDPARVLGRSSRPVLCPKEPYEVNGFHPNVVFSCGADIDPNGTLTVYYGAADESTCAISATVDGLLGYATSD